MVARLDIILFGASGFTGKWCIRALDKFTKMKGRSLTWGIAGRTKTKLQETLLDYQKRVGTDVSSVPIVTADINDYESLKRMTVQAKVLINCCGPFRFFGEPVVKACIETGTHQVDVTGEPQYMETIQLKYNDLAQRKGVFIISACGFDSAIADLGIIFLQNNFKGIMNSVEMYMKMEEDPPKSSGSIFNYATWESAIHGLAHAKELESIRRKLYPNELPKLEPKLDPRSIIHKNPFDHNNWAFPFIGSDRSVIKRTQRYLHENKNKRPIQIQTYIEIETLPDVIKTIFYGNLFLLLSKFYAGRKLLLKYPELFTHGVVSRQTPSEYKMERSKFTIKFYGQGWKEENFEKTDQLKPNKTIIGQAEGYNPGYKTASIAVTLAAIIILTETEKLPERGGVYTPGAAFGDTSLLQQLQEHGIKYEIKSKL